MGESGKVNILIALEPKVAERLDEVCGGPGGGQGRRLGDGRSKWCRDLVYTKLGFQPPKGHLQRVTPTMPDRKALKRIDRSKLNARDRAILELYVDKQLPLMRVAKELKAQGIATSRGGEWHHYTVRLRLAKLLEQERKA